MALCNLGALMVLFGLKCNSVNRAGHDVRERPTGQAVGWPLGQALGGLCLHLGPQIGTKSGPVFGDSHDARVAELVDAHDSGSCPSNGVQVQLLPRAPLLWQEGEVLVGGFVCLGLLGGDFPCEGFFLFRNFLVSAGG